MHIIAKKAVFIVLFPVVLSLFVSLSVNAMTLDKNTTVYTTDTGMYYHLTDDCGNTKSPHPTTLEDALSRGIEMCSTCAKKNGMDPAEAKNITIERLPIQTSGDIYSIPTSDGTTERAATQPTNSASAENEALKSDEVNALATSGAVAATATASEKKNASSASTSNTTSSNYNSGAKDLMTEKQRRARFSSKTNPKRGTKPVTVLRPMNAGFAYADFAMFNSYNSENNLGGTPIYLLGTIMDIQPVKQLGQQYGLAVMVNDCDGYQWYMRCNCDQSKLAMLKAELLGKSGNIFGTYSGYSGVTNRPMMDITMVFEIPGNAVNMALYQ